MATIKAKQLDTSGIVSRDASPALSANLDVGSSSIVSSSNANIDIAPDGTGQIVLDTLKWPTADGSANQVLKTDGNKQLSWVDQTGASLSGPTSISGTSSSSPYTAQGNTYYTVLSDQHITLPANTSMSNGDVIYINIGNTSSASVQISITFHLPTNVSLQELGENYTLTSGGTRVVSFFGSALRLVFQSSVGSGRYYLNASADTIRDLNDVHSTAPTDGQVLTWDNTNGYYTPATSSTDVASDSTPQLGGDLDVQARIITTSTTNGSIGLEPDGTGTVVARGTGSGNTPGTLTLNCEENSHGVALQSPPHASGASYTLKLPTGVGSSGQVLATDGNTPAQLSWVTPSSGGSAPNVYTETASFTVGSGATDGAVGSSEIERIYLINNSATAVTVTLPAISGNVGAGFKLQIKRLGTANVTVSQNTTELIDGSATQVLSAQYSSFTLTNDGTNWYII